MSLTQSRSVTSNRSVPDMPPPGRKMSSAEITSFLALNTPIPRRKSCRENEVKNFKRLEIKFRLKNDEVRSNASKNLLPLETCHTFTFLL